MLVKCISNRPDSINDMSVQNRIRRSIHLETISDLKIGEVYPVQAIIERENGFWLLLHTVKVSEFPYPYPAEMFEFQNCTIPSGWSAHFEIRDGNKILKRISFPEWASDAGFYEKLIDGDKETVAIYKNNFSTA